MASTASNLRTIDVRISPDPQVVVARDEQHLAELRDEALQAPGQKATVLGEVAGEDQRVVAIVLGGQRIDPARIVGVVHMDVGQREQPHAHPPRRADATHHADRRGEALASPSSSAHAPVCEAHAGVLRGHRPAIMSTSSRASLRGSTADVVRIRATASAP
jgi:hypothetical protein